MTDRRHTLSKSERLCHKNDISALLSRGKHRDAGQGMRFCFLTDTESELNRIMVSVPKRNFKRAVKRNLIKRRIRESYRLQKHLLTASGVDILFIYTSKEILPYADIFNCVTQVIAKINDYADKRGEKQNP